MNSITVWQTKWDGTLSTIYYGIQMKIYLNDSPHEEGGEEAIEILRDSDRHLQRYLPASIMLRPNAGSWLQHYPRLHY